MNVSPASAAGVALNAFLVLVLGAPMGRAQPPCSEPGSAKVALAIEPPNLAAKARLEQQLAAELRARDISVCREAAAGRVLAHVRLQALTSDLSQVIITIQVDEMSELGHTTRTLDVRSLPNEARPLAIASATDELLRSTLDEAAAGATPPPRTAVAEGTPRDGLPAAPVAPARPYLELGLGGIASTHFGHRNALGGDFRGRWWPAPRVSASARIGATAGSSKSTALGSVRANERHAALALGFAFVPEASALGLSADAALRLSRVAFEVTPEAQAITRPGSAWALVASAGAEGWFRTGALCFSASLAALIPVSPARARAGNAEATSIAGIGAEANASVWLLLGRARQ